MPIYEYRCQQGHTFEVMQRMADDPPSVCSTCEAPVQRVFRPIAVHFKGSGFYNTDYGTRKRAREKENGEGKSESPAKGSESSSGTDSSSGSGSGDSKGSEASKPAKPASTASTPSAS